MLGESLKWIAFLIMLFFGLTSLVAFISAQIYVKTKLPKSWEIFFPGRTVGFSHDLKFHKFVDWFFSLEGSKLKADMPFFVIMWRYYAFASKMALSFSGFLALDFFVDCYKTGMVGGWRF